MSPPALVFSPIARDVAGALARVPSAAGVGQIVAAGDRSLVVGMASNLRRWAASHLGLGKPPAAGRRPRTDLSGIATAIGWLELDGPFRQRLAFERLMATLVPLDRRRDLEEPVFLHLDPDERFPRVGVRTGPASDPALFGPFRDRRAAQRARDALHRRFPLRPCDYVFEPDPQLALGTACVFAQVRSCAAPCLRRLGEDEYRALAARAASWLSDPLLRADAAEEVPAAVARAASSRALVVDAGRETVGLVPVLGGRVLDAAALSAAGAELEAALGRLGWPPAEGSDDWPWLLAWLRSAKARASYLLVRDREPPARLAARVRAALPARFGGNLGATRGEA